MESARDITDIDWDLVISGTGLQASLLALAFSRSNKKILHLDTNTYYGAAEAALSLQEAETWSLNCSPPFRNISIWNPPQVDDESSTKLSFSRAYTLSLTPFLIYSRSNLIQALVSSRLFRQLEFQAVGSWWIYDKSSTFNRLKKVPNGREDVFSDPSIDLKAKRFLMKFLKFVLDYENQRDIWEPFKASPFPTFLSDQLGVPLALQEPLLALTLTPTLPENTSTSYAVPRIARHLRSIGLFGPSFAAVVPKWGGASEIAQVACRAGAVGGAVYMLGQGVKSYGDSLDSSSQESAARRLQIELLSGEKINCKTFVTSETPKDSKAGVSLKRSVVVSSSPLTHLFPCPAEGAPKPAVAIVCFPSGCLDPRNNRHPPIYSIVHSSETGECPDGQSVVYSCMLQVDDRSDTLLDAAVSNVLVAVGQESSPEKLYELRFTQDGGSPTSCENMREVDTVGDKATYTFPQPSLDLALSDSVLNGVQEAWAQINTYLGESTEDFLQFPDRETEMEDEET
ncbi:MAG: Rab proteins geranylgeranyltransferase component A [Vezdaea aestivalis]|nr:MAG: Rab proteins geranylgeranyltransferase component A [Vezdaea aestivalis]